ASLLADEVLGELPVIEGRLGAEAVERVEMGELLEDLRRGERQPHHLLADRDRVLEEAALLVERRRGEVTVDGPRHLTALEEQICEQDEVVGIAVGESNQALVLVQRSIQV